MSYYDHEAAAAGEWPYRITHIAAPPTKLQTRIAETKAAFLDALGRVELGGSVALAAHEAGVTKKTAYLWIEQDEELREKAEHIRAVHAEMVEASMHWAAMRGDVQAAKLVLAAKMPEQYGTKRVEVSGSIGGPGKDYIESLLGYCGVSDAEEPAEDDRDDDEAATE